MRGLVCAIEGRRHVLDLRHVRGVVAAETLTPVPTAPPEFRGVTQVRGQIVPVVDLGAALGARPPSPVVAARFVEVEAAGVRLLLDAGEALDIADIEPAAEGAAPVEVTVDVAAVIESCARRLRGAATSEPA